MLFTDALVITGIISQIEIAKRSSIGLYFFVPPAENERMIEDAGFEIVAVEDLTPVAAEISKRWHDARAKHRDAMIAIEGVDNFEGLQDFLQCGHTLTSKGGFRGLCTTLGKDRFVNVFWMLLER